MVDNLNEGTRYIGTDKSVVHIDDNDRILAVFSESVVNALVVQALHKS